MTSAPLDVPVAALRGRVEARHAAATDPALGTRLSGQYALYTLGVLLQKIAAFILIPLYTAYLSTADYGVLEIINTWVSLLGLFAALGVPTALNKCYHRDCRTAEEQRDLIGTALLFTLMMLSVVGGGLLLAAGPIAGLVLGPNAPAVYIQLALGSLVLSQTVRIVLELSRTLGRAGQYVSFSLLQVAVQISISVILVVVYRLGVTAILVANLLAYVVVQLVSLPFLLRHARLRLSWSRLLPLAGFGLAMIPVSAAGWVTSVSDRFFLQHYASTSDVGIYALAYKFGGMIELALILPFQKAWNPTFFSIAHQPNAPAVLARTLTYYFAVLSLGVAALTVAAEPLVRLMAHGDYLPAAPLIPLIASAYLFAGIASYLGTGLIVANRTYVVALVVSAGALVNLALNAALIPPYGMTGAAVSTIASFGVTAALTLAGVWRWYRFPIEYGRLAKVAVAVLLPLLIGWHIRCRSPLWEMLARGGLMFLVPPFLIAARFPDAIERRWLGSWRPWNARPDSGRR